MATEHRSLRRPSFRRQVWRLRWLAPVVPLAVAALLQWVLGRLHPSVPEGTLFWIGVLLHGLLGTIIIWLALGWLARNAARQEQTEAELRAAYESLAETHRQLLAVHDIGREIASAEDIQHVLEVAARAPVQLTGAIGAAVVTFDETSDGGERLKLDMAWGLSDTYLAGLRRRMAEGISAGRCLRCEHLTAHVSSDCPLFIGMQELARKEGIQSLICLPISVERKREGIISAYFPSPHGPPEEQVRLLNIVATEIAAALDSVRLRASQMASLYAVENLPDGPNLEDLLTQVLDTTLTGWRAQGGALLLYDEAAHNWSREVQRGILADGKSPSELAHLLAEEVRRERSLLLIADIHRSPWSQAAGPEMRSAAATPLTTGNEFLGVLVMVATRADHFEPRHEPLMLALSRHAALSIRNAQLHAQVQRMAVVEERYRLSREIHDGLAQTLGALGWQIDRIKQMLDEGRLEEATAELEQGRRMVREAYADVREAIDDLRLDIEQAGGLATALAEYAADFERRSGVAVTLNLTPDLPCLTASAELQLLRIAQEALTNVRKHAQARHVEIGLRGTPDAGHVTLTVADDGRGFDADLPRGRGRLGLATMRERAQSLGGEFSIITGPNRGTRIRVTLPC